MNINKRLFCIKRLTYLPLSVRLQFFKTFILPSFDYCSSLSIYYTKTLIQKTCNIYYFCLFKLFGLKFDEALNSTEIYQILIKYNLLPIQFRLCLRIGCLIQKTYSCKLPSKMSSMINDYSKERTTRSGSLFRIPHVITRYGKRTFSYYATNYLNLNHEECLLDPKNFKQNLLNTIEYYYTRFIEIFDSFNIKTRHFIKLRRS
jgi:hypothetical protein